MCEHNDGKTSNIPPHTSNLMRTPPGSPCMYMCPMVLPQRATDPKVVRAMRRKCHTRRYYVKQSHRINTEEKQGSNMCPYVYTRPTQRKRHQKNGSYHHVAPGRRLTVRSSCPVDGPSRSTATGPVQLFILPLCLRLESCYIGKRGRRGLLNTTTSTTIL